MAKRLPIQGLAMFSRLAMKQVLVQASKKTVDHKKKHGH